MRGEISLLCWPLGEVLSRLGISVRLSSRRHAGSRTLSRGKEQLENSSR